MSTTLLPYEDGNKTAVLDVTGNFAVSDVITVVGLTFTTFSSASAADSLELELEDDGVVSAEDDKTIEISSNQTPTVASAIPDTTVVENNPAIDNYRDLKAVFTDVEDGSALTFQHPEQHQSRAGDPHHRPGGQHTGFELHGQHYWNGNDHGQSHR